MAFGCRAVDATSAIATGADGGDGDVVIGAGERVLADEGAETPREAGATRRAGAGRPPEAEWTTIASTVARIMMTAPTARGTSGRGRRPTGGAVSNSTSVRSR